MSYLLIPALVPVQLTKLRPWIAVGPAAPRSAKLSSRGSTGHHSHEHLQGGPSAADWFWKVGEAGDEEAFVVNLFAFDPHTAAPNPGKFSLRLVVDADVDLVADVLDQTEGSGVLAIAVVDVPGNEIYVVVVSSAVPALKEIELVEEIALTVRVVEIEAGGCDFTGTDEERRAQGK